MKLEIRQIEIESPIKTLNIGDDFHYKGHFVDGYRESVSKIKRFYKEVCFWDGIEREIKDGESGNNVWVELEDGVLQLIGFCGYKNKFQTVVV